MAVPLLFQKVSLASGATMPLLHLGTYLTQSSQTYRAVLAALDVGYRAIDSAQMYENEAEVGAAIRDWLSQAAKSESRTRKDIFFTTKLAENEGYNEALQAIRRSVEICGLAYVDLLLLHSPYGGREARLASWRAIETAISEGIVISGGVSNFGERHLQELLSEDLRVQPLVNQIEVHPFNARPDLVAFCQHRGIQVQAYCPLVHGLRMEHPAILAIAKKFGRSASQVLLRWSIQKGIVPLPKSTQKARMIENADIGLFKLLDEDMRILNSLDESFVADWDPTDAP